MDVLAALTMLLTFYCFFVLSYCYLANISYYVDHKTRWNLQEYPFQHNAAQSAVLNVDFSFVVGSHHVILTSCFKKPRRHKFLPSRHKYYPNSNSTFQLQIFLISGDILPNPGPTKCPCSRCEKPCKSNQRAIQCDGCDLWCHAKCAYVSSDDYNRISSSNNARYCNACFFNLLSDSFVSESTGDLPNNSTATISDIFEPDVIIDYKTSIAV